METIKDFKIKENERNYDQVLLIQEDNTFIVMNKWSSSIEYFLYQYNNYEDAYKKYIELKKIIIKCYIEN